MHIFISYARSDGAIVRELYDEIVDRGREVWVDWQDLKAFDRSWHASLFAAIESCETFVFIMSPASVESGVCAQELAHAVQHGKRLAVIVHQPVPDQIWKERLPWLETPQWFLFKEDIDFSNSVDKILSALDEDHDHVKIHTRLYIRAREWEDKTDESLLLRGSDLQNAEAWLTAQSPKQPPPTPLHYRYAENSRKNAIRELVSQLSAAIEITSNQIDPTLNALLTVEAYKLSPSPQAEKMLRQGLRLPRLLWSLPPATGYSIVSLVSQDGSYAAIAENNFVKVFEIPSGIEIATLKHTAGVSELMFSPTGKYLMTWENTSTDRIWRSGPVRVWEIRTGSQIAETISEGRVATLLFDQEERYAAAGNNLSTVIVMDLKTGLVLSLKHRDAVVNALAFDPNGRNLACCQAGATRTRDRWVIREDNDMWIWGIPKWSRIARIRRTREVECLAYSPNGDYLVAACLYGQNRMVNVWKKMVTLWRTRFYFIGSLEHYDRVNEIAFHPRSWWTFATACNDNVVRIISALQTGDRYRVGEDCRLTCDGPVLSVAFSHSDKSGNNKIMIAAGGRDLTAREWEEITRVIHPHAVKQVTYSSNGKLLITRTSQGGIYVWESNRNQSTAEDLDSESLIQELGMRLQRNLTLDEWRTYFADEPYRLTFEHLPSPDIQESSIVT